MLSKLAVAFGAILLVASVALLTNGYFCTFNKVSCGMVEPLIAVPAALLGACLTIAGILGIRYARP